MSTNDKSLKKWKAAFAKDDIVYDSDEEYREAVNNLTSFVDALIEIDKSLKRATYGAKGDRGEMYVIDKFGNKIIL
jgi:hypothetical protein